MKAMVDGLEKVAIEQNFSQKATTLLKSPFQDPCGVVAGVIGVIIVFFLAVILARLLRNEK